MARQITPKIESKFVISQIQKDDRWPEAKLYQRTGISELGSNRVVMVASQLASRHSQLPGYFHLNDLLKSVR
ncbi:MAG: hypothetical protein P8N76_24985 [Pirellulaceae bacterium]|nr:hypothetical protein [Pirellulaceae bacterium]